mgnify:CR=1 FL=1
MAVAGRPNVGKSSLLNALAKRDVAIVSEIAGTTRDVIEVRMDLGGLPVTLLDTAGLRESDDIVEQEGMRRAWAEIQQADRLLLVIDDSQGFAPEDQAILDRLPADLPHTLIHNNLNAPIAAYPHFAKRTKTCFLGGTGLQTSLWQKCSHSRSPPSSAHPAAANHPAAPPSAAAHRT